MPGEKAKAPKYQWGNIFQSVSRKQLHFLFSCMKQYAFLWRGVTMDVEKYLQLIMNNLPQNWVLHP